MLYLKHTQKNIKSLENLLFPCRIFLNKNLNKIEYEINSKLNDKVINKSI